VPGPIRVLDLFPFGSAERARLDAVSPLLRIEHRDANTQEYIDALEDPDIEILLAGHGPSDPSRLPRLRWIGSVTAGVEEILVHHPERNGIRVTNGSGLHVVAMGEYVLASLLQVAQRIPDRLEHQRKRHWPEWRSAEWFDAAGNRLRGSTIAIIGYGSVGREVGRVCSALGMRVVAVKARPAELADPGYREHGTGDPDGTIPDRILGFDAIYEAIAEADFVVIAVPLTDRTRGLIDADLISHMRPTAWLINIGRGGHADERALLSALKERRIAGAVLDVFAEEPLPSSSPFWDLPNVIITPHLAGVAGTKQFWSAAAGLMCENLRRYVAGEPLLNTVDPARGY
jgi:phosphoglycerate dehydrogenase-like enzyme